MVRVMKIMIVAFVSILLFCDYTNALDGRIAAAAASGVDEEVQTTTHSWYDNDGGGRFIPVSTRKLRKKTKAAKEAELSGSVPWLRTTRPSLQKNDGTLHSSTNYGDHLNK